MFILRGAPITSGLETELGSRSYSLRSCHQGEGCGPFSSSIAPSTLLYVLKQGEGNAARHVNHPTKNERNNTTLTHTNVINTPQARGAILERVEVTDIGNAVTFDSVPFGVILFSST